MNNAFKHKYAYLSVEVNGDMWYYLCCFITDIDSEHISFIDDFGNMYSYRCDKVIEIKISNRQPSPVLKRIVQEQYNDIQINERRLK